MPSSFLATLLWSSRYVVSQVGRLGQGSPVPSDLAQAGGVVGLMGLMGLLSLLNTTKYH